MQQQHHRVELPTPKYVRPFISKDGTPSTKLVDKSCIENVVANVYSMLKYRNLQYITLECEKVRNRDRYFFIGKKTVDGKVDVGIIIDDRTGNKSLMIRLAEALNNKLKVVEPDIENRCREVSFMIITPLAAVKTITKALRDEFKVRYNFVMLDTDKFYIDIGSYCMIPKHIVMTQQEVEMMLKKERLTLSKLPWIYASDPMAIYIGARPGNVIKIIDEDHLGPSLRYRRCGNDMMVNNKEIVDTTKTAIIDTDIDLDELEEKRIAIDTDEVDIETQPDIEPEDDAIGDIDEATVD